MESLYRKYRPQTFADVVGQQHVVSTLEHAVLEGRTSHAYLFCGPRGTGKTTMARLLAKALMCEQGPGQLPDGTCHQCQLIAAGEHPDVYELDAASRTGVDNVREEIINSVGYAPTVGRYKMYIIDEVHMLTTAAFNALLKTLEEPPSHVVFVLCTTDPQKIPATILSRVQRFDFRPIAADDIRAHLAYVCEQEGFTYEEAALDLVTLNARGGMRDALSTLEQLSTFGSGVISADAAQDLLGGVSDAALTQVVNAMAARDVSALFTQVGDLVNTGHDLLQFTRELAAYLRDVYVVAAVGANPDVLSPAADVAKLQAEAAAFGSADRLARILTLLGDVSREMVTAPNQRLVLEICFTRVARPQADLTLESLAERVAALEAKPLSTAVPQTAPAPAPTPQLQPAPAPRPQQTSAPQAAPAQPAPAPQQTKPQTSAPAQQPSRPASAQPAPAPAPAPQSQPVPAPRQQQGKASAPAAQDPGALQRAWRQVVGDLVANIPARGTLLTNAVALSDDGNELVVGLPKGSTFAMKMLERADVRKIVEDAVRSVMGPRTLRYKEGTQSDLQLPNVARGGAQAPKPAPQRQAPQPPANQQPAPSQQAPSYPMPWDEPQRPAPQSRPAQQQSAPAMDEPPYEQVPYEELEAMPPSYGNDYDAGSYGAYEAPAPAPQAAPAQAPAAQQQARPPQPAPAPEPKAQAPAPTPEQAPAPEPAPQQPASEAPAQSNVRVYPSELPPELAQMLENAFEVFGSDVKATKE